MPKIIEMKKSDFLKKVEDYLKKKEGLTKFYTTPAALSAVKIRFMFSKPHEIALKPHDLLFFTKTLGKSVKAKPTDSDVSKKYYFRFCGPLLQELTTAKIYVGKNAKEKLQALTTYLNGVKDDKVIFEIISSADLNTTAVSIQSGGQGANVQGDASPGIANEVVKEEEMSFSESFVESSESTSAQEEVVPPQRDSSRRDTSLEDASRALLEEHRRKVEEQEFMIKGLTDQIDVYKRLAEQSSLRIRETGLKIRKRDQKAQEREATIANLKQALETLKAENLQLKTAQASNENEDEGGEGGGGDVIGNLIERLENPNQAEGTAEGNPVAAAINQDTVNQDDEYPGHGIDDLIRELDDEEAARSLHLTEVIEQWKNKLLWSRSEPVSVSLRNRDNNEETQTIDRFLAIAKLEREKVVHLTNPDLTVSGSPWLKEEVLTKIRSDSYDLDLACFGLYQEFPKELKLFGILFAFWELAHHNRFYRNALATVLNGGAVPRDLGMPDDADQTDVMLKLLHYADLTRILMGHYDYIAHNQFGVTLFVTQDENKARFGNVTGEQVDIARTTTEARLFI